MDARKTPLPDLLKHAPWLNGERILLWEKSFALTWIALLLADFWQRTALGITDVTGKYIGRDFINYWTGARLAAEGRAALAYDPQGFHAFQKLFGGPLAEFHNYAYPPTAMLLSLPLSPLTFMQAFVVWSLGGLLLCAFLLSRGLGWTAAWLALLASPAVFRALYCGQNGLFTAALLAGGILLCHRRPWLAGMLFGLLCYKPHLALLVPVALAAGRHWRCFASAAVTAAGLTLASAALLGPESWQGFFQMSRIMRGIMELGMFHTQPTVFSAVHFLLPGLAAPYFFQAVSLLLAAAAVFVIWRGGASTEVKGAALILGAFLATPYAWDHDMVALTFAAVWIAAEAARTRFLPWEKLAWMGVILLPVPLMALVRYTGIQPAPLILWAAFVLVFRRSKLAAEKRADMPSLDAAPLST
jgi:hypothetical protein